MLCFRNFVVNFVFVFSSSFLLFCSNQANHTRVGKKSKITRDRDRDVSEQIALGQSNLASSGGGDHSYDQRLFDRVILPAVYLKKKSVRLLTKKTLTIYRSKGCQVDFMVTMLMICMTNLCFMKR